MESREGENVHYDPIINIKSFFNYVNRRICFDCRTLIKSKPNNFRHVCRARQHCLACRRPTLKSKTWFLPDDKKNYCDKNGVSHGICTGCNLTFQSQDCQKNHRKSECRRGFKCGQCHVYLFISGKRKTKEDVLRMHKCGERYCKDCYTFTTDANHVCQIKQQSPQHDWNKLCFLSFGFLSKEAEGSRKEFSPNQACLIFETGRPGNFQSTWIESEKITKCNTFFERYWPDHVTRKLNNDGRRTNFGKKQASVTFKQFEKDKERDIAGKLIKYLLEKKEFQNYTVVTPSSDELLTICGALVEEQLYPTVLRRDNLILEVLLKDANIRFIDINNFQGPVSKYELLKKAGIEDENKFYPHNLSFEEADSMVSPHLDLFKEFNDTPELTREKLNYVAYLETRFPYLLGDQGKNYTYNLAFSLAKYSLAYVRECFNVQLEAENHLGKPEVKGGEMPYLHPLSSPFVSNGAFIYGVYRWFDLNKRELKCVPREHIGLSRDNVSKGEAQWMFFIAGAKGNQLRAYNNHRNGQDRRFKHLIPDGYDEKENIVYFYNGCYYHNHDKDVCLSSRPLGKKLRDEEEDFSGRLKKFTKKYPAIRIEIMWECQWSEKKKNNPAIVQWFQENPWAENPPLRRLIPREAMRGGHAEVYHFFWEKKENPHEELIYADIISQYPDIALTEHFPVGDFDVIIGDDLKDLELSEGHLSWRGSKLNGLIFLSIEAPKNMEYPFLLHRTRDNRSVATLCSQCAENQILSTCLHDGMDRCITGVYTSIEINYAISLGYRILHVYEAHNWSQQEKIFQPFMQLLLRRKVMYSGFPSDILSNEEKINYCAQVNTRLNLSGELTLKPSQIESDPEKRRYWKLLSCSVIGKMGQSNLFPQDVFIDQPHLLDEYLNDSLGTVETVDLINPRTLYFQFKPKKNSARMNRSGNVVIAALLTAHGRINMHKSVVKVSSSGATVYSVEADAIVFSKEIGSRLPINLGNQVGDFKQEYR